jgi:FixJ family two-component response regulator
MSKYNPDFWEIPFDPQVLDQLAVETFSEEQGARTIPPEVISILHTLIQTRLTSKQRRILEMYFFESLNEQTIASQLGISQQVVSKHLFGVIRDGKKVGGAVKKLQKILSGMDIDPKKWV